MPRYTTNHLKDIIRNNRSLFVQGNVIPNAWLCATFELTAPERTEGSSYELYAYEINRFNLRRAYFYTRLNKILADYGLVIRQSTNRTTSEVTYKVQDRTGIRERLETYTRQSEVKRQQFARLSTGYTAHRGRLPRARSLFQ